MVCCTFRIDGVKAISLFSDMMGRGDGGTKTFSTFFWALPEKAKNHLGWHIRGREQWLGPGFRVQPLSVTAVTEHWQNAQHSQADFARKRYFIKVYFAVCSVFLQPAALVLTSTRRALRVGEVATGTRKSRTCCACQCAAPPNLRLSDPNTFAVLPCAGC
jgi:hypothetical protein